MGMEVDQAVAAAAPVDPLFALLVGALGASLLGLLGAWIQSRREHRKWLREQRFEAYRQFMIDMSDMSRIVSQTPTLLNAGALKADIETLVERFSHSFEAVSLLGPKSVNAAGTEWTSAALVVVRDRSHENRVKLNRARWQFLIVAGRELKSANVGAEPHKPTVA